MSVRSLIDIETHSWNKGKKRAYVCYPGMCGSMQATITWAHKYGNKDTAFVMQLLQNSIEQQEKVRNVIKRFNRRFN